jgi:hypothetical protein
MIEEARLPRWLKFANPVIVALQRRGVVIGTMRLLSVPGRKSCELRTTPVSPLATGGKRYVIAGFEGADWVKNARSAGWGILARGREQARVSLIELPPRERGPVLREFPHKVPHGVRYFRQLYVPATLRHRRDPGRVRGASTPVPRIPGGGGWYMI